jgi:hypothetical protein
MEIIENRYSEGLAWLRFVLCPETGMPTVSDWAALYAFADKQKILGVCDPTKYDVRVGIEVLSHWIGDIEQIKNSSLLLNKRIEELYNILDGAGFSCCILKGQGNAEMYHEPLMRMPGDIDVWIDADEKSIQKFVKDQFPEANEYFKHIKFPVFDDVPVDVHVTPLKFHCSKYHKRLQRWISLNKKEQFEHRIHLTGIERDICVPTAKFNAVYLLGHMLIHFYDEGVGFRHLVDYFYLLKNFAVSDIERLEFERTIASLGMKRFASAVMWIEKEVLGLPEQYVLVAPDKKLGESFLKDVLDGGNFGKYSQRYKGKKGFYWKGLVEAKRVMALSNIAPCEASFCLLMKMRTAGKHFIIMVRK